MYGGRPSPCLPEDAFAPARARHDVPCVIAGCAPQSLTEEGMLNQVQHDVRVKPGTTEKEAEWLTEMIITILGNVG